MKISKRVSSRFVRGIGILLKKMLREKMKRIEYISLLQPVHLNRENPLALLRTMPPLGQAHPLSGLDGFNARFRNVNFRELIYETVKYLDVTSAEHLRYASDDDSTFCNVYAYDVCYLLSLSGQKCYLPRVWWKDEAIELLRAGEAQEAIYGATVKELTCNQLFSWMKEFGEGFGWKSIDGAESLQLKVNSGFPGVIISRNFARKGHISVVLPEWLDKGDEFLACRSAEAGFISPLQSQAGRKNVKFGHCLVADRCWYDAEEEVAFFYLAD